MPREESLWGPDSGSLCSCMELYSVAVIGFKPLTPPGYEQYSKIRAICAAGPANQPNRLTVVLACRARNSS
jgi:hypothetical protein